MPLLGESVNFVVAKIPNKKRKVDKVVEVQEFVFGNY